MNFKIELNYLRFMTAFLILLSIFFILLRYININLILFGVDLREIRLYVLLIIVLAVLLFTFLMKIGLISIKSRGKILSEKEISFFSILSVDEINNILKNKYILYFSEYILKLFSLCMVVTGIVIIGAVLFLSILNLVPQHINSFFLIFICIVSLFDILIGYVLYKFTSKFLVNKTKQYRKF